MRWKRTEVRRTWTGCLPSCILWRWVSWDVMTLKGVEEDVLAALQLLTHDDGQDYFEYVRKIAGSGNITAIHVKTNDLKHNLDRGLRTYARAEELCDAALMERLARINDKHRKALHLLEAAGCGAQCV